MSKSPPINITKIIKPLSTKYSHEDRKGWQYLLEVTDYSDTNVNVPSNVYIVNRSEKLVAYVNSYGELKVFSKPLYFEKRHRKFERLSSSDFNF